MVEKSHRLGRELRPHFKTHQSKAIGEWFKDFGVHKIAVSSISMAEYFSYAGWDDILVAIPVNLLETELISRLSRKVELTLVVDNLESLNKLGNRLDKRVNLMVEINTGQDRSGIRWDRAEHIAALVTAIQESPTYTFTGFMAHGGQTYAARGMEDILRLHEQSLERLRQATDSYREEHPDLCVSYGDTPACSVADQFDGVDELRPGNFVFYDLMQEQIGACKRSEIAVATACPVIGKYPEDEKVILYGGSAQLSKDFIVENDQRVYGKIVFITQKGWEFPETDLNVVSLSQEHAKVKVPTEYMHRFECGRLVGVLPAHSCLTANMMNWYRGLDGSHFDHMLGST